MYALQYLEGGWWLTWSKHFTQVAAFDLLDQLEKEHPTTEWRVKVLDDDSEV